MSHEKNRDRSSLSHIEFVKSFSSQQLKRAFIYLAHELASDAGISTPDYRTNATDAIDAGLYSLLDAGFDRDQEMGFIVYNDLLNGDDSPSSVAAARERFTAAAFVENVFQH